MLNKKLIEIGKIKKVIKKNVIQLGTYMFTCIFGCLLFCSTMLSINIHNIINYTSRVIYLTNLYTFESYSIIFLCTYIHYSLRVISLKKFKRKQTVIAQHRILKAYIQIISYHFISCKHAARFMKGTSKLCQIGCPGVFMS